MFENVSSSSISSSPALSCNKDPSEYISKKPSFILSVINCASYSLSHSH